MTHLERLVTLHEGLRLLPYRCPAGKQTIGIGRNLDDTGITEAEARHLLAGDLARVRQALVRTLPWFDGLDEVRQSVLLDLGFNVGVGGLLKFPRTLAALREQRWGAAARELLDSRYASQVGARARRLARMIETGQWPLDLPTGGPS